jgi:2-polyprenyl-3-methyl-5-hydroxy-6-metoxy-1,4-benzoquinol methylase
MPVQDRYSQYQPDQRNVFDQMVKEDWESFTRPSCIRLNQFEVTRLLAWTHPAVILNVGCGYGFHDAEMAKRPFVQRVDAFDYSSASIAKGNELFKNPKIHREVVDFLTLEPRPEYDCVVSFQVIEHLENPEYFLRRCAEWCKPGGIVAVYTVNFMRPYNRIQIKYGKQPILEDPMHKMEFTHQQLQGLGIKTGLLPRKIFGYLAAPYNPPYALRLWLGYWFPHLSERLGAFYQKPNEC